MLQLDHDPDIERYYYFRSSGKPQNALRIFETRLKPRYPDERLRLALFRTYRSHDPVYRQLITVAYRSLTERSLDRVRRIIIYIDGKIAAYDEQDVYSTIKAAEDILKILPKTRYEAIEGIKRFFRYSQLLNFHVKSMEKAAELVQAYHNESLSAVGNEFRRRETVQGSNSAGDSQHGAFSSVTFTPADLSRIEISPSINRVEDQTLAYCFKYWNLVGDSAFERILFLYSRKYGKKNHDVYILIRQGKRAKFRDDEILGTVMSALSRGYYYSVLGDRYLQQQWVGLREILMDQEAEAKEQASARKLAAQKAAALRGPKKQAIAAKKKAAQKKAPVIKAPLPQPGRNVAAMNPAPVPKKRYPRPLPAAARPSMAQQVDHTTGGSVSDRLRVLSGRSYDLYRERFLTNARPAIRKVLGAGKGIFFNLPEKAEDLVYNFLRDHYADPYMNWAESKERAELTALGFRLESLNPVIDECFKSVKD